MNLRDYERESIRAFVGHAGANGYLSGRVLDFGCGQQPYRDLVAAAGGEYIPFDRAHFPGNVSGEDVGGEPWPYTDYDTILCTQVIQYVDYPADILRAFKLRGKVLVMTYPTTWAEVEAADRWRFTKAGMTWMLEQAGFAILLHERRGTLYDARFPAGREKRITALSDEFAIGYGVVARA